MWTNCSIDRMAFPVRPKACLVRQTEAQLTNVLAGYTNNIHSLACLYSCQCFPPETAFLQSAASSSQCVVKDNSMHLKRNRVCKERRGNPNHMPRKNCVSAIPDNMEAPGCEFIYFPPIRLQPHRPKTPRAVSKHAKPSQRRLANDWANNLRSDQPL